jgi:hypothetical protein
MGILNTLARQGRKIKKLAKPPTEGQKKIETPVKEQRAYAKGQAKAAGATLLTTAAVAKMSLSQMEKRLEKEENEKNRAILKVGIEKAVAKAMSNTADKKYKGGAMGFNKGGTPSRKGNYDMRKGGMFMKGTK